MKLKTLFPKLYAEGLVGEEIYSSQDPSQQARVLLMMTKDQIRIKSSFYNTFLGILRSELSRLDFKKSTKYSWTETEKEQEERRLYEH